MSGPFAFVTLLSSDSYLPGALVLAASLKDTHPSPPQHPEVEFQTVCLVTPETVDVKSIKALRKAFDVIIGVELIGAQSSPGLQLLGRPDLATVLTKLHVFRLTQYSKIIYLDADVLPLQPLSHLFLTPHEFSACPDVGWPDIFNSGCMVLEPGEDKFQELTQLMNTQGSWDGADQGLLNEWRGGNWNRLSFTYNTTPTAAYTYAPAYKRFGSSIKAIHFIGQNKPWSSIPWRAPIEHPSADSKRSYGYSDLVDRWFAVYDRHYRPPVFATEEEYRVQHYAPVWETAAFEASSQGFGLEDLKRMAIEGVSQSSVAVPGEGEYKSMPLEGRIDLMRLPRPDQSEQPATTSDAGDHDRQKTHDSLNQHRDQTDHCYRPPGREGLPSYLYDSRSQPSHTTPSFTHHGQHVDQSNEQGHSQEPEHRQEGQTWVQQQGSYVHQEAHSPVYRPHSPPLLIWNPAVDPPPNNPPPMVAMAFNEQQYVNMWDLPAGRPMHQQQDTYHDPWVNHSYSHGQSHYPSNETRDHQDHHHQQHQHQHSEWNQPHHHQHHPGPSSFPTGGAYDPPHSHSHQESTYPGHSHIDHHRYQPYPDVYHGQESHGHSAPRPYRELRPEDFFKAPETKKIPSHLVREGHYAAVTTSVPMPDVAKVEAIFPWEQRPRPTPRRVFPDWDPKPPGLKSPPRTMVAEIEEALIAAAEGRIEGPLPRRRSPSPPPHVQRKFNPPPSPPLRQGAIYVNAWDTDHGIQRYASKLQGRPSPFSPQPWPSHPGQEAHANKMKVVPAAREEEEEYTNWTEKAEASSRDGDDEDDEEDEAILSPRSAARRRNAKAKGNSYRHQGVQTDPKVTYSRGVQVSSSLAFKRPTEWDSASHPNSYGRNGYLDGSKEDIEEQAYETTRQEKPLLPAFEEELADPAFKPSVTLHDAGERAKADGENGSPTAPVLRKRDSSEDSITTAAESSIISSPTKEAEEVGTPRVRILIPEPAEGSPVTGRIPGSSGVGGRRMGGRVFSPTTGVDIFKRGSEEVLARFLMHDPSGWGGNRETAQDPPTPSAIH